MTKRFTKILVLFIVFIPGVIYSQITTQEPLVLVNSQDTICDGSVLDIPFTSTGIFTNGNTYMAQLSDSTGNFTGAINVLGILNSTDAFSTGGGVINGNIISFNQPVPAGCNYYIRVVSTHPVLTGATYGPFCIRHCDIKTNNFTDLHFCISQTTGVDTSIGVDIHVFDPNAVYTPSDTFKVQVLSSYTYNVLNTGDLGYLVGGTTDTVIHLHIPGIDSLANSRMGTGEYYMRVVATNSNEQWNTSGTLIRLVIGAPQDTLSAWILDDNGITGHSVPDTTVCSGSTLFYGAFPYNSQSTFQWTVDGNSAWPDFGGYTGINFVAPGTIRVSVVENNNGCVGHSSDTVLIHVDPAPVATFNLHADNTQLHHYIAVNNSTGTQPINYVWSWGDNTHDSIAYPSHVYADSGFYNICLSITDASGCSSLFCDSAYHMQRTTNTMVYVNVTPPVAVINLGSIDDEIKIYPNPADDRLTIHASYAHANEEEVISIMNVLGEKMQEEKASPQPSPKEREFSINIKNLPAGIYFLQMKSESGSVVKRFVKE